MTTHHRRCPSNLRVRTILAAITGVFAGAIRAIVTWLLDQLTTGC
jgi:hypothetical protein